MSNLNECINFEVSIANKICCFIHLYRSLSQTQDEFQIFRSNIELNLDLLSRCNPFLTIMIGDFHEKSKQWCKIDKTSFEGSQLQLLTSKFVLSQIITEPTHILENSRSCIDLLFTSQPNMVMDSGLHASLHHHCHHQIIFAKFDLKVFYPPPYERTVCHFSQANSDHLKRAVDLLDRESALIDLDINEQVSFFNDTITNIMSNFVPDEIIICNDRDAPWMNRHIKILILRKTNFFKTFVRGKISMFYMFLTFYSLQNHLNQFIQKAKQNYLNKFAKKLIDQHQMLLVFVKTLLNDKKYHVFHLYFLVTSTLLILKKSEILNIFFAEQCSLIPNKSVLPSQLTLLTENSLANCHFSKMDILQIIRNSGSNKAHGHYMISIRMLKLVTRFTIP